MYSFSGDVFFPKEEVSGGEGEEIELTLGLSMNGRFGVDPRQLARSSSIPDLLNPSSMEPAASLLLRSCSLPVKTEEEEEELRKRKEIQSLRRLEAKMKRTAKQRHSKGITGAQEELQLHNNNHNFKIPKWVPPPPQASSVAVGSQQQQQGSDSSSESDTLKLQGVMRKTEGTRSRRSITEECEGKAGAAAAKSGKLILSSIDENEMMLENMPCVSTKGGDGPNGKRIQGFLYRYSKKDEVRIVCVCHGTFLSPLEFVQHAGAAGDVAHPLRHILVNHSPFF